MNLASAESLFTPREKSLETLKSLMPLDKFRSLTEDQMYDEITRVLPLLSPFSSSLDKIQERLGVALSSIEKVEGSFRREDNSDDGDSLLSLEADLLAPDPTTIKRSKRGRRVTLNVGGVRHEVQWKVLEQLPQSRLGLLARSQTHQQILSLCSDYNLETNEYFFDRHPRSFNAILNFYRTGKLHITDDICVLAFSDDLFYWKINEVLFDSCCLDKFVDKRELIVTEMERTAHQLEVEETETFGRGRFARYQKCVWDLMEKPESSMAAKIVSIISMSFVFVSIVGMVISTLPALQYKAADGTLMENPWLGMIETICIAWFTLEYFLRFAGAPAKCKFLTDGINIIDALSILPFFVSLFLQSDFRDNFLQTKTTQTSPTVTNLTATPSPDTGDTTASTIDDVLQIFRIFKLARVLKLARHSPGLQAIAYTLQHSYKELGLLVFLMGITSLIIGSLCYYIELGKESGFTSIPTAIYYCIITMTTVGYGDISPTSGLGKLVGALCAAIGVLVLSLPIPIIAQNFENFHKNSQRMDKAEKSKKMRIIEKKKEFEARVTQFRENDLYLH